MKALITGGNTGVGWWIAYRLLEHELQRCASVSHVDLTLACRSVDKAERARADLLKTYPDAHIDVLKVDVSSPKSVRAACDEYKQRHGRLDLFFANAGIMPVKRVNWLALVKHVVCWEIALFLETSGRFLEQPVNLRTCDGFGEVFAANIMGHYLMVRFLEDELANGGRVFWTGSSSSNATYFDMDDIQCLNGMYPYQSSKHALDLISHAINLRYNSSKQIYSINTAPGTMISQIATNLFPEWVFTFLAIPFFVLLRLITENLTITGYNATESIASLFDTDPKTLDLTRQYVSVTSFQGSRLDGTGGVRAVVARDIHITDEEALEFQCRLDNLVTQFIPVNDKIK